MNQTDPLLQPFQLKHLTLKNRILSTSHEPAYVEDAKPKLRYQLYHEEKAKGGIALTMFGGSSNVALDSPSAFGQIYVGNDDVIPYFQEMAEAVRDEAAKYGFDVLIASGDFDPSKQRNQMSDFIIKDVDK